MAIRIKNQLQVPEENYVYFHHTNTKIIIPVDPETVSDSMGASWAQQTPLSRTAPIYSYQNSGPRNVQVQFMLHRDLCNEYNNIGYDAVEVLITNLDQMVLPDYNSMGKIVNPPVVSLKLRDEIFIKGVVSNVSHDFRVPIINYGGKNKYAIVNVNFGINEIMPFSASIIPNVGQYRPGNGYSANGSGIISSAGNAGATIANAMGRSAAGSIGSSAFGVVGSAMALQTR